MLISLIRTAMIYLFVILAIRFMGKRQIGELQPTELVITILISEVVAIPMQDKDIPMISAIIPVVILVVLEVIISGINMKSLKFRRVFTGSPVIVVNNGKLEQNALKRLRFSIEDLLDALRTKDVFDLSTVQYAIVETNGDLTVMLKPEYQNVETGMLNLNIADNGIPFSVINDGQFLTKHMRDCGVSRMEVMQELKKRKLAPEEVMLMTVDRSKNFRVVERDGAL